MSTIGTNNKLSNLDAEAEAAIVSALGPAALTIAKTSGLQAALDGKEKARSIAAVDLVGDAGPYNSEAEARIAGIQSGESYRLVDGSVQIMRASLTTGAVNYVPLQGALTDIGTGGATVTATGTTQYAACRYGQGFDFDGSTMLEFVSTLDTSAPWAIFATIRPRGGLADQIVISRTDASLSRDFYLLYNGGSDRLTFAYYTPAGALVTNTSADSPSQRIRKASSCRVGFGFDGTNIWCSMDGEIWLQVAATMDNSPSVPIRLGGPLDLGASPFYSGYTGQMQEVAVYQSGITAESDSARNFGHGLIAGVSVPVKEPNVSDVANVYIQTGQSNGQVGYQTYTGQQSTWPAIGLDERVNWAGRNGAVTISGEWKHPRDRASFTGPDYWYLRRLADSGVPSIHGITSCVSGMSIVQWADGGAQWTALTGVVDTQLALLTSYKIRALIWNQGEQDATTEILANAYQARLETFIALARAEWGGDLPIVCVIPDLTPPYGTFFIETVRTAIATVAAADPMVFTVDSRGYERIDGVHVSQFDMQKIGHQIARILQRR